MSQSLGEYRVGVEFNPSKSELVHQLKQHAAAFINAVEAIGVNGNGEIARCKTLAMTAAEDAAMWAVKAATKPEPR